MAAGRSLAIGSSSLDFQSMKVNRLIFPVVLILVALPLFIGFAGPEAAAGRWDRIARSEGMLARNVFAMRSASARDDDGPYVSYREALDVIKANYAGDPIDARKTRDLTYAAIRGMLYSLNDPYTSFLDTEEWNSMQQMTRGDFDGIGAMLG